MEQADFYSQLDKLAQERNEEADIKALEIIESPDYDVNWQDEERRTSLFIFASNGRPLLVKALLDKGANPNH
jgi:ankyrin repeat protein